MLSPDAQVLLQSGQGRPSVQLTDLQSGTTVEIKELPPTGELHNSPDEFLKISRSPTIYLRRLIDPVS